MPNDRIALLRVAALTVLLFVAAGSVTVGAAMFAPAAGWIVGGVLLAALAFVVVKQ